MEQSKKIIMYGTDYCADCFRAIKVFENLKVDFDYVDIDQNQEAENIVTKINHGNRSVPTIIFPDNTTLTEPLNIVLQERLQDYIKNSF